MKILTNIRFYFVVVTISFLGLLINYLNLNDEFLKCQTEKGYVDSGDIKRAELQQTVDSLHDELFISKTTVGRYELSLEHLKEINPKAAKDFETFLETQTE